MVYSRAGEPPVYLGGTGIGGGTLHGLGRIVLDVDHVEHLLRLAKGGDISKIDLRISDIASDKVLPGMPRDMTAANFGRLHDLATPEDKALGLLNMVFETVATCAMFAARPYGVKNIVLTGNLSRRACERYLPPPRRDGRVELYNTRALGIRDGYRCGARRKERKKKSRATHAKLPAAVQGNARRRAEALRESCKTVSYEIAPYKKRTAQNYITQKSTVQNCTAQNCFCARITLRSVALCSCTKSHEYKRKKARQAPRPESSEHAASAVRFLFLTVLSCFYRCRSISRLSRRSTCRKRRQHSTRRYRDVLRVQNSDLHGQQGRRKRWFCRDRCLCGAILSACP